MYRLAVDACLEPGRSRYGDNLPVGHVLIQQRMATWQELIIARHMVYYCCWIHLEEDPKHGLGHIELKTCSGRTAWAGARQPFRPVMSAGPPEFSRSVPGGSMVRIDTVLEKIVGAGLVGPMMEPDQPLR